MINSLVLAAKRGVDVRIVVPGIPDKRLVYTVTSSYFEILTNSNTLLIISLLDSSSLLIYSKHK